MELLFCHGEHFRSDKSYCGHLVISVPMFMVLNFQKAIGGEDIWIIEVLIIYKIPLKLKNDLNIKFWEDT